MDSYQKVYREQPEMYDQLVSAEDVDNNLTRALAERCGVRGSRVVEAGCGTGRLTKLLLELGAEHVQASEIEPEMLKLARAIIGENPRVDFAVADVRSLPYVSGQADLSVAGWVLGHFRSWMADRWREEMSLAIGELTRVLRPGGTIVILETLGTGMTVATPPSGELAEYYLWLEEEKGFKRQAIRTDYEFESVAQAALVTGAFFGDSFATLVRTNQWRRVPECSGIWSRQIE